MPKLHKSWNKLRRKLRNIDHVAIAKRVGVQNSLVILVDDIKYDSRIPILYEKRGLLYVVPEKIKLKKENLEPVVQPKKTLPKEPVAQSSKTLPKEPTIQSDETPSEVLAGQSNETTDEESTLLDEELVHDRFQSFMKSSIDELVVSGPFEDEFAKYKDDDDDDDDLSVISKNMKKIRYSPVKKPTPISKPVPPPKPVPFPKPMPVPKQPPKPEPPKPDWARTKKQLQLNRFHDVLLDFISFESELQKDENAKSVLKEAVMKCVQEDETSTLIKVLEMMYKLEYGGDFEWWSELVQKLKRKLFSGTKFKVNLDPARVREYYQQAATGLCKYANKANIALKLPYRDFLFIVDFDEEKRRPVPSGSVFNVSFPDIKPKIEKDAQENLNPKQPIKEEKLSPEEGSRKVEMRRKFNGQVSYKISSRRGHELCDISSIQSSLFEKHYKLHNK